MVKFRDKFDPATWAEIYESSTPEATRWGFHRATEIAKTNCLMLSQKDQLWLDVGSGTGHLAHDLNHEGLKMMGVDHDRNMIIAAKRRFPKLNLLHANAQQLPFPAESFDGIIAVSVMGCFDSPEDFYMQSHRVLKPGGILILTCTNKSSLLLKINARLKTQPGDSFHLYSISEVSQDLRRNNFELVGTSFYNFFLNPGGKMIPSISYAKSLEWLSKFPGIRLTGRNFIVTARKR
jgi:ubiquinone/menaquinone biosynthesis C-methylase UbiE